MATLKNTTINDTGFLLLPKGDSSERPINSQDGMIRYNEELNKAEAYLNDQWDKPVSLPRYVNIWSDFFTSNTLNQYIQNNFQNSSGSFSITGGRLSSGTSNQEFQIRVNPNNFPIAGPFDNIYAKCEYLGTGDNDKSSISVIDTQNRSWTFGITNDFRNNGLLRFDSFTSTNVALTVNGVNFSVTESHTFELVYKDGLFKFYVDGRLSLTTPADIQIQSVGIVSHAQNPPAFWNSLEAWVQVDNTVFINEL